MKKIAIILLSFFVFFSSYENSAFAQYEWAQTAVKYCVSRNILSGMGNGDLALGNNITREQMARILVDAFSLGNNVGYRYMPFIDISQDRWSYNYIGIINNYMKKSGSWFSPDEDVTREEFVSTLVLASGLTEANLRNRDILSYNFKDASKVDSDYQKLLCIAVERGYYVGSDGYLSVFFIIQNLNSGFWRTGLGRYTVIY